MMQKKLHNNESGDFSRLIQSVNLHITKSCNYRCEFCYAHFNQISYKLTVSQWKEIIRQLKDAGTKKITFVGGEPTLVPFLQELIHFTKSLDILTMLVTNGSKLLRENYLESIAPSLDFLGLSIDSGREEVNKKLGRGTGNHVEQTIKIADRARFYNIPLKVNTVITSLTWKEDMEWLIQELQPFRWKVFQMLPIEGENNEAADLLISNEQFNHFISTHTHLNPVGEVNDDMINSYAMIDPEGRFFDNSSYKLNHGLPILRVGVKKSFESINFNYGKFIGRDGDYFQKPDFSETLTRLNLVDVPPDSEGKRACSPGSQNLLPI